MKQLWPQNQMHLNNFFYPLWGFMEFMELLKHSEQPPLFKNQTAISSFYDFCKSLISSICIHLQIPQIKMGQRKFYTPSRVKCASFQPRTRRMDILGDTDDEFKTQIGCGSVYRDGSRQVALLVCLQQKRAKGQQHLKN